MTAAFPAYAPAPGPVSRVLFEDEQRRHRRAGRWYAALAALAVALAGIPLSLLVTPLVFLVALVCVRIAELAGLVPPIAGRWLDDFAAMAQPALQAVAAGDWPPVFAAVRASAPLLLPGAVVMLALWIAVRRLLARSGAGGLLLALRARTPDPADFEERQLGNLVEEMAIAAGLPPPSLRILDRACANAGAVGTSPDAATVVVSRGLIERIDRDETQAVIGHVVASIGNGDLRIAGILLSVEQTLGLLLMLLHAPFGARARGVLAAVVRAALGRSESAAEQAVLADVLAGEANADDANVSRHAARETFRTGPFRLLLRLPILPLLFAGAAVRITTLLLGGALFRPGFAALWRRRRRLADAMSVQLSRNPEALDRARDRLRQMEHRLPDVPSAAYLFIVWERAPAARGRYRFRDYLLGPSGALLLVLPPLLFLAMYLGAFVILALVVFNFLFLGLLLWGLTALVDACFAFFARF